MLGDPFVFEVDLFDSGPENIEYHVLHVSFDHCDFGSLETLIVFDDLRLSRGIVCSHDGINKVTCLRLKCSVKDVEVQAILD